MAVLCVYVVVRTTDSRRALTRVRVSVDAAASPCAVAALWQASTLLENARSAVSVLGVTSRAVGGRPVAALQQLVSDMGVCSSWCGAQSVVFLALRAPS